MTRYAQRTLIQQPSIANWGKAAPQGIGVVNGYGVASGGTNITQWTVSTTVYNGSVFNSDGTLTVATAGLFDYAIIGGGGGAGGGKGTASVPAGGPGGAGMYITGTVYLTAGTYAVEVGAGESGVTGRPVPSASGASAITNVVAAIAGGGGAG